MTAAHCVGAIDQGTTGTSFVVFDGRKGVVGNAFQAHDRQLLPPDRVEYDPEEIWQCARAAIQSGLDRAGVDPDELDAIGIANQRQTTVVWDRETGVPIGPALSWQDRRARSVLAELPESAATRIRERTGCIPDPYFAGAKLAWLLANVDAGGRGLQERAEAGEVRFGTVDAWLLSRLTGRHVTDVTNAAQTMLFDIHRRRWDDDLLELFGIPRDMLPAVHPSSHPTVFGETDLDGLFDVSVPVTGVIGNQQAALVGHGGFEVGSTKVSYGSGNFALQHVGHEPVMDEPGVLGTIWFQQAGGEPYYGLEGPVFTTGTALEWLAEVGVVDDPDELVLESAEASDREPGDGPIVAWAGAPRWSAGDRGTVVGLSRHTSRADLVGATVDGIGFATRSVLEAIAAASGHEATRVYVDGGAIHDDTFAQRQANLMGRELRRSPVTQTSARGAAVTAGMALDRWSIAEVTGESASGEAFVPAGDRAAVTQRYRRWCRVAERLATVAGEDPSPAS